MAICSANGCSNRSDRKRKLGVSFHKFPKNYLLREKWIKAMRRLNWEPGVNSFICSEHFSADLLNRTSACGRTELRENAVPTIFSFCQAHLLPPILVEVMPRCSVLNCTSNSAKMQKDGTQKSFFRFPNDETLIKKWALACHRNIPNLATALVCADHFKEEDYTHDARASLHQKCLRADVVPSVNLGSGVGGQRGRGYFPQRNQNQNQNFGRNSNYRDEEYEDNTRRDRGSQKSRANRARDKQRGEARREHLSTAFQTERDEKIKESFLQGISEDELSKRMGKNVIVRPLPLSISTRGIGFGTQWLCNIIKKYNFKKSIAIPDINSIYRTFLGVLEAKMQQANFGDSVNDLSEVKQMSLPQDFIVQANSIVKLPEPIHRIIGAVGMINSNNERFLPCVPKDVYEHNNFVPSPQFIYLSNLRRTVEALANPVTPIMYRRTFRAQNPIPGTKWSPDDLLMNADDIIPPIYDIAAFSRDTLQVAPFVNKLETYAPKLGGGKSKILDVQGRRSIFMSNLSGTLHQPELGEGNRVEQLNELYKQLPLGDIDLFWSRHSLNTSERVEGILALVGELPVDKRQVDPICTNRTSQTCTHHVALSYSSAVLICFS